MGFQGKHKECRQRSLVCEAHLPAYTTQSLPYGQQIKLSKEDIDKVKTVLRKYLTTDCLKEFCLFVCLVLNDASTLVGH